MILFLAVPFTSSLAQDPASAARKIVTRNSPQYPQLARTMNVAGTVKLEAMVASNGSVKSIDVKGGNPLLVQSAESSVRGWKWEKLDHETTEFIEIHFTP